jgi:hypothetical protein
MTRKQYPEEAMQKTVVQFLGKPAYALPKDAVFWHTPNQRGTRAEWENKLLKAMGTLAGFPDIAILYQGQLYLIELKSRSGTFSPVQKALHARLATAGAKTWVCFSFEQVVERLKMWKIPLSAA